MSCPHCLTGDPGGEIGMMPEREFLPGRRSISGRHPPGQPYQRQQLGGNNCSQVGSWGTRKERTEGGTEQSGWNGLQAV